MYTYNYSYGYSLGYSGGYNPYINYTWQMLPNAKVKNSGTSGVDLQLYSGNPLDFQATQGVQVNKSFTLSGNAISLFLGFDTDSIAITHTLAEFDNLKVSIVNAVLRVTINAVNHDVAILVVNTYYQTEIVINSNNLIVKVNGTQTYSASCTALNTTILKSLGANDGLASGRFDGQFDYFIVYNGLTTFSLPNQFFKDMSTNSNTVFCTDFRGTTVYIADSKSYSVGNDKQVAPDSFNLLSGTGTITNNGIDTFKIILNGDGSNTLNNNIVFTNLNNPPLDNQLFNIKVTITINSGSFYYRSLRFANANSTTQNYQTITSTKSIEYIFQGGVNNTINQLILYFGSQNSCDVDVKVEYIKSLTGVYLITNYSATQRTNFTQESKGLQDLTRLFDSNGFFLDNTDYLNCNGKGKATVIEPSRTSKVTIQTNPTILSGNILSGGVTLTTAGLTAGIDNDIVLDNQAISSNIDIGVGYKGKVTIYKEDLL